VVFIPLLRIFLDSLQENSIDPVFPTTPGTLQDPDGFIVLNALSRVVRHQGQEEIMTAFLGVD